MVSSKSTKSPAFQFYPRDFMTSDKVARMSLAEIGIYITLLCYSWLGNGLPSNLDHVAKLVRLPPARFKTVWAGVLSECFVMKGTKLVNPRQERQRKELEKYIADCQKGGARSAEARRERYGTAQPSKSVRRRLRSAHRSDAEVGPNTSSASSTSTSSSSASSKENVQEVEGSAPLLTFVTVGEPPSWGLAQDRLAKWEVTYPNLDVAGQCRRAQAWLDANPLKRKTASGMPRFLVNWLNNAVDRPHGSGANSNGRGRTGAPPRGKYDGIEEHD